MKGKAKDKQIKTFRKATEVASTSRER